MSIKNCCDIVFQKGQIFFAGFALFIFIIYAIDMNGLCHVICEDNAKTHSDHYARSSAKCI